ncbi:MAG: hypothetical protein ACOCQR_03935 [bacterium]
MEIINPENKQKLIQIDDDELSQEEAKIENCIQSIATTNKYYSWGNGNLGNTILKAIKDKEEEEDIRGAMLNFKECLKIIKDDIREYNDHIKFLSSFYDGLEELGGEEDLHFTDIIEKLNSNTNKLLN